MRPVHEVAGAPVDTVRTATLSLLNYCRAEDWSGHDPYDALNSPVLQSLPLLGSRIPRLALTQALKRSPVNLRGWLRVPKTQNPKALALFLSALLKLSVMQPGQCEDSIQKMIERLVALRSAGVPYWCWGYSFPWQGRKVVVPRGAPNLVCTTFVAGALLDCYERRGGEELLAMAVSASEYLLNELYWQDESSAAAGFSYPLRSLRSEIHNANFLAAALLCRVYKLTGDEKFVAPALSVARYSAAKQRADGSWYYGEAATQRWIDNFHTGFNLSALAQIDRCLASDEFEPRLRQGFEFYKKHFFRADGAARYFHDRTYPIDIHCVAQSILTPLEFQRLDSGNLARARSVFDWAMRHMWDERGFFYYRVLRTCTIRTSYMRWSQAWMLLALITLLAEVTASGERSQTQEPAVLARA
jgi:hypothetical protein